MGTKAFRKIQVGTESTSGTAVAATAKLLGALTMREELSLVRPEYEMGRLSRFRDSEIAGKLARLQFQAPASFEQLGYFLLGGVKGGVTPTTVGSVNTWDFDPSLEAANSPDSLTMEYGDDQQAYESEFCIPTELRLSGGVDAAVQLVAEMFGRQVSTCSFTGSLSDPSPFELILFNKAKLYIDESGAGIGGTVKAATLISMDVRIPTGFTPQKFGDGELYFASIAEGSRSIAADLTFAFNATGATERTKYADQSKRFIRIAIEGTTISGSDKKFLYIDFCGRYVEDLLPLGERDGLDIVNARLESCYDDTWTKEFQIQLQNSLETMP